MCDRNKDLLVMFLEVRTKLFKHIESYNDYNNMLNKCIVKNNANLYRRIIKNTDDKKLIELSNDYTNIKNLFLMYNQKTIWEVIHSTPYVDENLKDDIFNELFLEGLNILDSFDFEKGVKINTYLFSCLNFKKIQVIKKINNYNNLILNNDLRIGNDFINNCDYLMSNNNDIDIDCYDFMQEIYEDSVISLLKNILTKKEYEIIKLRFGFENETPLTLQKISEKYLCSKMCIYNIEKKALEKIKKNIPYIL